MSEQSVRVSRLRANLIIDGVVLKLDGSIHRVMDHCCALVWDCQTDHVVDALRKLSCTLTPFRAEESTRVELTLDIAV